MSHITNDRFIPRRSTLDLDLSHYKLTSEDGFTRFDKPAEIFDQRPKDYYKRNYVNRVWSLLRENNTRVLSEGCGEKKECYEWPVRPRKKPLITKPENILGTPYVIQNAVEDSIDWSASNFITTIYDSRILLWCPRNEKYIYTKILAKSFKWDNRGQIMAICRKISTVHIFSFCKLRVINESTCSCATFNCCIMVFQWSKDNKLLAYGCSKGWITIFSVSETTVVKTKAAHFGEIMALCLSPRNETIASSGTDGYVKIWQFPSLRVLFKIDSVALTIEFHPWNESLLAVGDNDLTLWNVALFKQIDVLPTKVPNRVDCLTWNPLSGELVTSHFLGTRSQLSVLSNFNTVVDTLNEHEQQVKHLKWKPDYTQLATASSNEFLCIWNFFGSQEEKYRKKREKKSNQVSFSTYKSFTIR